MDLIEKNEFNIYRHPWEISRADSILKIIKRKSPDMQYVDIGAGDLFFTRELTKYTNKSIFAVDTNYTFLHKTDDKIIPLKEVSNIPKNSADCMILMDVLEHVKNDYSFLKYLLDFLKEKGELVITVPAYQFLFCPHDCFLKHYRRYSKKQLQMLLGKLNLKIKETFYFYTLLFVIRYLQIILLKLNFPMHMEKAVSNWKLGRNNIITMLVTNILNIDFSINRALRKIRVILPGLSLCVICQKKSV